MVIPSGGHYCRLYLSPVRPKKRTKLRISNDLYKYFLR